MNTDNQNLPMAGSRSATASQPPLPDLDILRERTQSLATDLDRMQCTLRAGRADAGDLEYNSWLTLLSGLRH
jgi:hypothetical protein